MDKKWKPGIKILTVVVGLSLLLVSTVGCAEAVVEVDKEPLKFADGGWDSVQFLNRVAAYIAENGYDYPQSEFLPCESITMIQGTRRGDMDIIMEGFYHQQPEVWQEGIDAGEMIMLGVVFPGTWQGWLVPTYMIEEGLLPEGLSVFDMPDYWELFKDPEDPTKGRFYSCIPGWMCQEINEGKIKAYGLDETYNVFTPGSDAALSTSMTAAYEKHEPWFGYYWSPTWILAKYDMTAIEEPAWEESKWDATNKMWEVAYPVYENYIFINSGLSDKAPEVVEFLEKCAMTYDHINGSLLFMQESGGTSSDAAMWFLEEYESVWTTWVPADVAAKIKATLP